jgi:phosphotransferase system enzyme I (PtsI)
MARAAEPAGAEVLRGAGVSAGIAIGRALVLEGSHLAVFRLELDGARAAAEVERLRRAVRRAWRQLRELAERVRREAGDACARVFEAQMLILRDPSLLKETETLIRSERVNAEWAFHAVVGRHTQAFLQLGDPDLRERGTDIEDVESRVQAILTGSRSRHDLGELSDDVIVVSAGLSPSDAAGLVRQRVVGLAIDGGGPTSHTAILASALGIPAIAGLGGASGRVRSGDLLILDGSSGTLLRNPSGDELALWRDRRARLAQRELDLALLRDLPAVTTDGARVILRANIELPEELPAARRCGAEGIGLYRSEFLHLDAGAPPDEERHYRVYRALAEAALPHPVVIRTLDLGAETRGPAPPERHEANPALGLRGVRLGLRRPEIFRAQLRGILRAAGHGRVRMMLPMVSSVEEVRQARALVDEARQELRRDGARFAPEVPLGIMIEVPAAALIAERLAREAEFFSIGTNDLIQSTLAIDRGNPEVAYLYRPLHPAILRLIRGVAEAAARLGRPVSVCGEMAAHPLSAAVLVGLGLNELSMTPASIPAIKQLVRSLSLREARAVVEEALERDTAADVEEVVVRRLGDRLSPDAGAPPRDAERR